LRARLDHWFEQNGIRPRVVGEFEDNALLKTFGESGMGVFPAAEWVHGELLAHYDMHRLGPCEGVKENFFAIGTQKKVQHPLVQRLLQASDVSAGVISGADAAASDVKKPPRLVTLEACS
jgi:LysR family transcriptional activator of nhaA